MLIVLVFGFIAGVIFAQVSKTGSIKPIVVAVIIGLVIGTIVGAIRVVPAGNVGIIDFFGKVSPNFLKSGINMVNPLAKVVNLSIRKQQIKETMNVPSKEGLNVKLEASVVYSLDPQQAVNMYKNVGTRYQDVILVPQFRSVARGVTAGYEAKALYTSQREVLAKKFEDDLGSIVNSSGIIVKEVLLRSITLPTMVSSAIEQKLKAEQEAEKMKFVLQKEQQEAERKRVEAQGIRDAQGIINESLTSQYLQYLWINTLNENPNVIYVATEANMPMFRTTDNYPGQQK